MTHRVMRKWGLPTPRIGVNLLFTHTLGLRETGEDWIVKPDQSRWRDEDAYDYLETLIVEDLAWECLRRNEGYQQDFKQHISLDAPRAEIEAAIARHWGLRFRGQAEPNRSRSADPLDARD